MLLIPYVCQFEFEDFFHFVFIAVFRSSGASNESALSMFSVSHQSSVTTSASVGFLVQQHQPSTFTSESTSGASDATHTSVGQCAGTYHSGGHAEWHRILVEMLLDDFLKYASEFPLQIRWILSELQVRLMAYKFLHVRHFMVNVLVL